MGESHRAEQEEMFRALLTEASGGPEAEQALAGDLRAALVDDRSSLRWALEHADDRALPGALRIVADAHLADVGVRAVAPLCRLQRVLVVALSRPDDGFTSLALSMVLRAVGEQGCGPVDPADSTDAALGRACNYRGCRLAEHQLFDAAREHFDEAIALHPRFAPAYCNRARVALERGDLASARADCAAMAAFDPDYPVGVDTARLVETLTEMVGTHGGTLVENAAEHGLLGFLRAYDRPAIPGQFGTTVHDQPSPFDIPVLSADPGAEELNHRGVVLGRIGRYGDAEAAFDRAHEVDPGYTRVLYNRGRVHLLQRNHAAAVADFTAYIDREPAEASAYAMRARAYRAAGNEALAAADDAAARLWSQ